MVKDEKENLVYYLIKVCVFGLKWELKKRYREFRALYDFLLQNHLSLPHFPPKTVIPMTNDQDLGLRKSELDSFMKVVSL